MKIKLIVDEVPSNSKVNVAGSTRIRFSRYTNALNIGWGKRVKVNLKVGKEDQYDLINIPETW